VGPPLNLLLKREPIDFMWMRGVMVKGLGHANASWTQSVFDYYVWYFFLKLFYICGEGFFLIISSPELRAQVSFSDRRLSVVPVVCPSVCKRLHFRLLLHSHWANFNQTWHKSTFGEGISVCTNEWEYPSTRGDACNSKRVKIHWTFWKIFFSRTSRPNSIKLDTN
jgi:hypothetical protein